MKILSFLELISIEIKGQGKYNLTIAKERQDF
jgi:hypothetical protein